MEDVLIIGIAGGTGSGKTTVAKKIVAALPFQNVVLIDQDAYYRDQSHLCLEERLQVNYDHPNSIENELLIRHLKELRSGKEVEKPVYDFTKHSRSKEKVLIPPAPIVVVEGILILADPAIREELDIKVFVDTDADIRVFRRIRRDMNERGRSFMSVRNQYYKTVRPMHLQFVEPSKRWANIIIPEGGENNIALDLVINSLLHRINQLELKFRHEQNPE